MGKENLLYLSIYLVVALSSARIFYKIVFENQVYTRKPIAGQVDHGNGTGIDRSANISDQWPFKMRLHQSNYVCTIPASNFNFTYENIIDAWQLPPRSRLSPIMLEMGLCRLGAEEMARKGICFDKDKCLCVESWPITILEISLFGMAFPVFGLFFAFPIGSKRKMKRNAFRIPLLDGMQYLIDGMRVVLITLVPVWVWSTASSIMGGYFDDTWDTGLWYTPFGQMSPVNYLEKSSDWESIYSLARANMYACMIASLACMTISGCLHHAKMDEMERAIKEKKSIQASKEKKIEKKETV